MGICITGLINGIRIWHHNLGDQSNENYSNPLAVDFCSEAMKATWIKDNEYDLYTANIGDILYYANKGTNGKWYGFLSGCNDTSQPYKNAEAAIRWCERHYKKISLKKK